MKPGKARAGIGAVEVTFDGLFDDRSREAVLFLEAALLFGEEPLEMIEHHPVEDHACGKSKVISFWGRRAIIISIRRN